MYFRFAALIRLTKRFFGNVIREGCFQKRLSDWPGERNYAADKRIKNASLCRAGHFCCRKNNIIYAEKSQHSDLSPNETIGFKMTRRIARFADRELLISALKAF